MDSGEPKEALLDWPISPIRRDFIMGMGMPVHARCHSAVSCAKMAEPIDLRFGLCTRVGRRKHKFNRIRQVARMCPHARAHWCDLANTIEPSVCGGDPALCQITLTTCRKSFCECDGSTSSHIGDGEKYLFLRNRLSVRPFTS